jgi:2-succinyl-6-hydroxy-2,4-cyclohexadiene-1-carboxylate synthase
MSAQVVLLHGFAGQPEMWDPVLRKLAIDVDAYCPVLPGHGKAAPIPSASSFLDVVDVLAEQLRSRAPLLLAGYSLGGRLALALALRHPSLVRAALLISAHPGIEHPDERAARRDWAAARAIAIEERGVEIFAKEWERLELFATQSDQQIEEQRAGRMAHEVRGLAWVMRTLGTGNMPPMWDALVESDVRLRVLVGALDDKYVTLARRITERAPRVPHRIVDAVGHNVLIEAPLVVAAELTQMLEEATAGRG